MGKKEARLKILLSILNLDIFLSKNIALRGWKCLSSFMEGTIIQTSHFQEGKGVLL